MLSKFIFEDITVIAQLIAVFLEEVINFWREQNIQFYKEWLKIPYKFALKKLACFTKWFFSESFIFLNMGGEVWIKMIFNYIFKL